MHVIFRDGLEDRDYLAACTHGAEELRAHALKPEHCAGTRRASPASPPKRSSAWPATTAS